MLKKFQFGEIKNLENITHIELGLFNETLQIQQNCDEIIWIEIEPNFENYSTQTKEKTFLSKRKNNHIDLENITENKLYFLVLKKKREITHLGFI